MEFHVVTLRRKFASAASPKFKLGELLAMVAHLAVSGKSRVSVMKPREAWRTSLTQLR